MGGGGEGRGVRELGLGAILTRILGCSRLSLGAILGKKKARGGGGIEVGRERFDLSRLDDIS